MAPKTKNPAKRPHTGEGSSRNLRSRVPNPPSPPVQPPVEQQPAEEEGGEFVSLDAQRKFDEDFSRRTVVFGKYAPLDFFEEHFVLIANYFRLLGWDSFIFLKKPMYTYLVRIFYTNLDYINNHILWSQVGGKIISIDQNLLAQIFHIPRGQHQILVTNEWTHFQGYDPIQALNQICGRNDIVNRFKPKAKELTLNARLIHHMITYNILPRGGGRDHVSYFDIFLIWCIMNTIPIDLPFIISNHIVDCQKKKVASLPYGFALTRVFEHFHIPLDEEAVVAISHTNTYSDMTLKQMHYKLTSRGWVPKDDPDEATDEEQEADDPPGEEEQQPHEEPGEHGMDVEPPQPPPAFEPPPFEPPQQPTIPPAGVQTILTAIQGLQVSMDGIGTRLSALENRQIQIENDMDTLKRYGDIFTTQVDQRLARTETDIRTVRNSLTAIERYARRNAPPPPPPPPAPEDPDAPGLPEHIDLDP